MAARRFRVAARDRPHILCVYMCISLPLSLSLYIYIYNSTSNNNNDDSLNDTWFQKSIARVWRFPDVGLVPADPVGVSLVEAGYISSGSSAGLVTPGLR